MPKYAQSMLALLTLSAITACSSVPRNEGLTTCPRIPAIAEEELGPDFQDRMRDFLRGKLPEETPSEQPSLSATPSTAKSGTPSLRLPGK